MMLIKKQKERYGQAFLLGLLVATAFFGYFMLTERGLFLYYGDFNVQQIPFYKLAHGAVRDGNIFWNWHTDLGVDFIGSYSFYLIGSPFFWLTLPFPNSWVPYLMGPLLILKFATASLTAYCYLRRFVRYTHNALIGALIYAFSGFSVYNVFFNHFHEAIVYFPLLLLAMELFVAENKRGLFAAMVFLCALNNYYFFFGMALFCIIYFAVKVISKSWQISFSRFMWLFFEALIGTLMAAMILLPTYFTVIGNERATSFIAGWSGLIYDREQITLNVIQSWFFPPDNPARPVFFPGADIKWSSISGWMPLIGMTGVIAWLQTCKCTWQKRLFTVCAFMALIPVLNSAFSMFNYGYYARWFYMPILIGALMTAQALERTDINWAAAFRWSIGITATFTIAVGLFPGWYNHDRQWHEFGLFNDSQSDNPMYRIRFWVECAIAIISLFIFLILISYRGGVKKRKPEVSEGQYISAIRKAQPIFWRLCVISICVVTVIYASCHLAWGKMSGDNVDFMIDNLIHGAEKIELDINDGERIDVYEGTDNTGMFLGYPTIQAFHSNVPGSVFEFYDYVDVDRGVGSRPTAQDYHIRGLLAVRYLIDYRGNNDGSNFINNEAREWEDAEAMPGFTYIDHQNDYDIYKNDCFIPYGFTYDYCITRDAIDSFFGSSRAAMLLKAMLVTEEQAKAYSDCMTRIVNYDTAPGLDNIGKQAYVEDCKKLQQNVVSKPLKVDNYGFTSEVTMPRKNLVFYAIPYEKGWSATVDGKPARVEKVNSGLMAVLVPEGEHTVRFTYKTSGLVLGIIISITAAAILCVYVVVFYRRRKQNPDRFVVTNVEREALMAEWNRQDTAELAYSDTLIDNEVEVGKELVAMIKSAFSKKPTPKKESEPGLNESEVPPEGE